MANQAASTERRYQTPALEKGLDILELLAGETEGLTQKEIALRLGRNPNEIFRMLICLEERGYIFRETSTDPFKLSLKLFELGLRNPPTKRLIEAATPALFKLAKRNSQSCHVTIPWGGNIMVVAQQNSLEPFVFTVNLGATMPLHRTVSGIVLLSYQTPGVRAQWLAQTAAKTDDIQYLESAYPAVLENGFFQQESRTAHGITELACPIFGHTGLPVATVSTPILRTVSEDLDIEFYLSNIRDTAADISRKIGWRGELGDPANAAD